MEKLPFTPIVPVQIDSDDRLINISVVVDYLIKQLNVQEVILVEYGKVSKLSNFFAHDNLRYIFVQGKEEPWNKPKVVNTAIHWIKTPVCAIWDADVVLPAPQVNGAVLSITEDKADFTIPYEKFVYIKRALIHSIRNGRTPFKDIENCTDLYALKTFTSLAAGCIVINTAVFKHIRGLNELFYGWGFEDDELMCRAANLGFRVMRSPGVLLHLTHERTDTSKPISDAFNKRLIAEKLRSAHAPPDQLKLYFGVSNGVGRYLCLSQPDEPTGQLLTAVDEAMKNTRPLDMYPEPEYKNLQATDE